MSANLKKAKASLLSLFRRIRKFVSESKKLRHVFCGVLLHLVLYPPLLALFLLLGLPGWYAHLFALTTAVWLDYLFTTWMDERRGK